MKFRNFVIVLFLTATSLPALADYGYMYKYCQRPNYSISASQAATLYGSKLSTETHVFVFTGVFGADENAKIIGVKDNWIIYKGPNHYLAVPWHKQFSIYTRDVRRVPGPGSLGGWLAVCQ